MKSFGCPYFPKEGNCMRTVSAFALKDAPIGQIVSERKFHYAMAEECDVSYATSQDIAYMYDHIGNVIGLAEMSAGGATVMEAYDMEAFGRVMDGQQNGMHLTTKEYHPENDLYYFAARWYDPGARRWIEKEPLRLDGPNYYQFVFNNPSNAIDINGLQVGHYSPPGAYNPYYPPLPDSDGDGMPDSKDPMPHNPKYPINAPRNCPLDPNQPPYPGCLWRCLQALSAPAIGLGPVGLFWPPAAFAAGGYETGAIATCIFQCGQSTYAY